MYPCEIKIFRYIPLLLIYLKLVETCKILMFCRQTQLVQIVNTLSFIFYAQWQLRSVGSSLQTDSATFRVQAIQKCTIWIKNVRKGVQKILVPSYDVSFLRYFNFRLFNFLLIQIFHFFCRPSSVYTNSHFWLTSCAIFACFGISNVL